MNLASRHLSPVTAVRTLCAVASLALFCASSISLMANSEIRSTEYYPSAHHQKPKSESAKPSHSHHSRLAKTGGIKVPSLAQQAIAQSRKDARPLRLFGHKKSLPGSLTRKKADIQKVIANRQHTAAPAQSVADQKAPQNGIVISVPDQKLVVLRNGVKVAVYPVSTSRYGVGDRVNSYATPLGAMRIVKKIGADMPIGEVFKDRRPTGEILKPNTPGRDPIVTRILWLSGMQECNRNAFSRGIYIHGTPQEKNIGRPASYGCIRMRSKDVVKLFSYVAVGMPVEIVNKPMREVLSGDNLFEHLFGGLFETASR